MTTAEDMRGRTALVTGATTGIGAEFATRLAQLGADLVLVARSAERLDALAEQLRLRCGVTVRPMAVDLSLPRAAATMGESLEEAGVEVEMLVNNAGVAVSGPLSAADPEVLASMIAVNVVALTELTTHFLPAMVARGHGTVVNVASTGAYQPAPYLAVYAATKAHVLSFTQALWAETRTSGVRVLVVNPGPTDTPMNPGSSLGKRTPRQVVDTTFDALRGSKPSVVDGAANALAARVLMRLLPERAVLGLTERILRPRG